MGARDVAALGRVTFNVDLEQFGSEAPPVSSLHQKGWWKIHTCRRGKGCLYPVMCVLILWHSRNLLPPHADE